MAISTIKKKEIPSGTLWHIKKLLNMPVLPGRGPIPREEVLLVINQLALMLDTNTPLNRSLYTISRQIKNPRLRQTITDITHLVEEGKLLSEAMSRYPAIFPSVYVSMIRAGERGGFLKEMLERIVILEERQQEFLNKLRSAMSYPLFLVVFATAVIFFIVLFIFPYFKTLFDDIYDSLPLTTKILMRTSHIIITYWYVVGILIIVLWFTIYRLIVSETGKDYIDHIKLRLPFIRDFFIKIYIARFSRVLGALINGNVPLLEALTISSNTVGSKVFSRVIDNIRESVEGGKSFSAPVLQSPYFPETVKQMIHTGEETGTLDRVMIKLADYYEKNVERDLRKITTVIEPVLLVIVGFLIGMVVISLIIPIFKITHTIH